MEPEAGADMGNEGVAQLIPPPGMSLIQRKAWLRRAVTQGGGTQAAAATSDGVPAGMSLIQQKVWRRRNKTGEDAPSTDASLSSGDEEETANATVAPARSDDEQEDGPVGGGGAPPPAAEHRPDPVFRRRGSLDDRGFGDRWLDLVGDCLSRSTFYHVDSEGGRMSYGDADNIRAIPPTSNHDYA